jgi:hypothetical protein
MDERVKLIEDNFRFLKAWSKCFRLSVKWLCIYPAILIFLYECYFWLRFAKLLDLQTYLIAPPKLLSFFYTFTNWEGVNIVIYSFLKLPVFVTMPLAMFVLLFVVFYSVLAVYHLVFDTKSHLGKLIKKTGPRENN